MNSFPNSRIPDEGKSFEIQQTDDEVVIYVRDRGSNQVCQVVSFRGQSEGKRKPKRLDGLALEGVDSGSRRW